MQVVFRTGSTVLHNHEVQATLKVLVMTIDAQWEGMGM